VEGPLAPVALLSRTSERDTDAAAGVRALAARLGDRHPDAAILWLDAHGDFHTPDRTQSEFLGGMCLAAACGLWDAGLDTTPVLPDQVHMHDCRALDPTEIDLLAEHGVRRDLPAGGPVFIHLDLDILDPKAMPAAFPAPGGLAWEELDALLAGAARRCEILGLEVTCAAPARADRIAATLAHLP
jgi:arginase family enzyme